MKRIIQLLVLLFLSGISCTISAQNVFGKALVPDMIADASIQEIDGVFYCSATTDGMGQGLKTSGPPVLWKSKDFVHWCFDGRMYPDSMTMKYWAPSKMIHVGDKWYSYPTLNGKIYVAVSDAPYHQFHLAKQEPLMPGIDGIDAEIFIDDNSSTDSVHAQQKYIFWNRRNVARLNDDMVTVDMDSRITIPSRHQVYSEGPCFFKRKGIYYYLYTLGGDENYQYAYMMSRTSPLGPYETPKEDIITTTNYATGTFGPGHGCVFKRENKDDYYMCFLEFGRNSTNRQTYVNRLEFNEDGTIKPIKVDMEGVGMLRNVKYGKPLPIVTVTASSTAEPMPIRYFKDSKCQRIEHFDAEFAIDEANGSRWMADEKMEASDKLAKHAWLQIDLGKIRRIKRSEIAFVRPTEGHAYCLEVSRDGMTWEKCGGSSEKQLCSPHIDNISKRARYLRVTILEGVTGIWEWQVY